MEIVKLNPQQVQKAADVVTAAFFGYPMFTFYFPDPRRRTRSMPWYMKNVLTAALRYGEVYTTPDISGVIFTLPPGHTRISQWEYIRCGFMLSPFALGVGNFIRSQECEDFVGNIHMELMKDRPHYYLWGLAVDPRRKKSGIGTALLQPLLARMDAEKMPFYLETHDENNVQYYQRHGFHLLRSAVIPKFDLPIWCMLREPV